MSDILEFCTVLEVGIERPQPWLQQRLRALGGRSFFYPVTRIQAVEDSWPCEESLLACQSLIFVSRNAVLYSMKKLKPLLSSWQPQIIAIGPATARALQNVDVMPQVRSGSGLGTEALWSFWRPGPQSKLCVVRGQGGRRTLARMLRAQGCDVLHAMVYRRRPFSGCAKKIHNVVRQNASLVVVLRSGSALMNLMRIFAKTDIRDLLSCTWLVPSERVAALAARLGYQQQPIIAQGASDDAIVDALIHWRTMSVKV